MHMPHLTVLSDAEVRDIHEASVAILTECGVQLLSPSMLDYAKSRGLTVDVEKQCVRMPRACIEDALAAVPHTFDVYGRDGAFAFTLGDGTPRIAAGHNAVFWVDSESGKTRPSTVADVGMFARICEALPHIDMIGIPVMPQDVAIPESTLLHGVKACVENSRKPIFFSTDNRRINKTVIEMLAAIYPGDMREQPYGISQLSPTSPLFWEGSVLDALRDTVEAGVPLAILPEPIAGISAPYTLAGLLTMNNAECLSGIVLTQLIRPGARVLYANSWTTSDMRSGAALVGSCETSICRIAGAQLGKFYGVPTHTTAPNSDNHAHDEQNAWEKTLSTFCAVGAGNDLIVNCGMFATGLTCSHEQLVMDEEISAMSRRIAAGVLVNKDTIAKDLIVQYGPHAAEYLSSEHTLEWLHSGEYFMPRVAVRGPRSVWEAQGAPDTYALAKKAAGELGATESGVLDEGRRTILEGVVRSF